MMPEVRFEAGSLSATADHDGDVEIVIDNYDEYATSLLVLDDAIRFHAWLGEHIARRKEMAR